MDTKKEKSSDIVDCFLGFNEIKLATFRIMYLEKIVSHTVIAESSITHSGARKPLFFKIWHRNLPENLKEKITIIQIDLEDMDRNGSWDREIRSREELVRFAGTKFPYSRFIISDLDEIPSRQQINNFLDMTGNFHFRCQTSYRYANFLVGGKHDRWDYGVLMQNPTLASHNGGRFEAFPIIKGELGRHVSYLGMDSKLLEMKLKSFAHTEYARINIDFELLLKFCDKFLIDHLGRIRSATFGLLQVENAPNTWSSIIGELKKFEPKWIAQRNNESSVALRLLASGLVSCGMRGLDSSKNTKLRMKIFIQYFKVKPLLPRKFIALISIPFIIFEIVGAVTWNIRRIAND